MYALAKTLDLPATYVELRHQATHEELPSLHKLRGAARKALQWIWERFWVDLSLALKGGEGEDEKLWVRRLVREGDEEDWNLVEEAAAMSGEERVLRALMDIQQEGEMERDSGVLLRALKLSRRVMGGDEDEEMAEGGAKSLEEVRRELNVARERLDQVEDQEVKRWGMESIEVTDEAEGWAMWEGPWIPTPIGTVR